MSRVVHNLIAKTAQEIAFAAYEVLASNDRFYKRWPNQKTFVRKNWQEFIGHARQSLAKMLEFVPGTDLPPPEGLSDEARANWLAVHPRYYYTQHVRDEIFEALVIDGAHKATPAVSVERLREMAGFEPLKEVRRRGGQIFH